MSDDWLQSKLEAEPCFILEFSDHQQLLLSRTKLEALCSTLPALPFLLFGHPSMKKKITERRSDNGIMVLTLMGVDLSIEGFLSMMNVVLGATCLPAEESVITDLLATVNLLGGCDQVEKALRICKRPQCPEQDVNDEFEWKQIVITRSRTLFEYIGKVHQKWVDDGWFSVNDSVRHLDDCFFCTYLLRRPKGHISAAQEKSPDS